MSFLKPDALISHFDITEGMHVADFGAGSGFFTIPLAVAVGSYGKVYAIDRDEDQLSRIRSEQASRGWGHIHVHKADFSHGEVVLPEKVDRVLLSNILFMMESKPELLTLAYSSLKHGGKMILMEARPGAPIILPELALEEDVISSLAEFAGFVREKRFHAGDCHYGIVFKKI